MLGTNKSNSARQIVMAMKRDQQPIVIKYKGMKKVDYRGYEIKVHPPLVEGADKHCFIGKDDIGLAFRHCLEDAKAYIDEQIKKQSPKIKIRRKITITTRKAGKPKMQDCPRCKGIGFYFDRICTNCKGTGETKCQ